MYVGKIVFLEENHILLKNEADLLGSKEKCVPLAKLGMPENQDYDFSVNVYMSAQKYNKWKV